jgi:hypothetical protein
MPIVTAATIINRAATALQDTSNVRWTRAELLDYLNAGQRETVIRKPSAYVLRSSMTLAVGTVQSLPSADDTGPVDPIELIEVLRNATGRAVRLIERDLMDQFNPEWHNAPQNTTVQHYMVNPLDPVRFMVYPPNDGTGCLDLVYSANPPPVSSEAAVITLDDIYQDALLDYVLYRAFSKDAEYAADPARAASRYAAFAASLDGKTTHERAESPARTRA